MRKDFRGYSRAQDLTDIINQDLDTCILIYSCVLVHVFTYNGIRYSLIANLNPINIRNDSGQLWENYCISERQKFLSFNRISSNKFFWRTYSQKEIDYLEEREGRLYAYEMKFSGKAVKVPASFIQNYPDSRFIEVNRDNFLDFFTGK